MHYMRRLRQLRAAWKRLLPLAGAALSLAVAACSSGTAITLGQTQSSPYAVFSGHLHLSGEIAVDGWFQDALTGRRETCAQYVAGAVPATTLWVAPTPNQGQPVNGHVVTLTAGIAAAGGGGFHGPATYRSPEAAVDVLIVDNSSFLAGASSDTSITVTANGSGSMHFAGLLDTDTNAAEAGYETWSCVSRATPEATMMPAAAPSNASATGPVLTGSASVNGAYIDGGTFTTRAQVLLGGTPAPAPAGYTCGDYARGYPPSSSGSRSFVAPALDTGGANAVELSVVMTAGYRGPGSYSSTLQPQLTGTASITIPPASAPQFDSFASRFYGAVELTVLPNGSGSVKMINWGSSGSDSRISGSASWDCRS